MDYLFTTGEEVSGILMETIAAILTGKVLSIAAINAVAIVLAVKHRYALAWGVWVLAAWLCVAG